VQEDDIGELKINTNLFLEYIKKRCHLEDLETIEKVFLKRVLQNGDVDWVYLVHTITCCILLY